MHSLRKYQRLILFATFMVVLIGFAIAQETGQVQEIQNDAKREEIQRYFGYELLLYRYLSLPYDVSVNVNQVGNFVDIGVLYLIFIPVLVLMFLRSRPFVNLLAILYLLFTWVISTSNGFLFSISKSKVLPNKIELDAYTSLVPFKEEPFAHILAFFYKISAILYTGLENLGNSISGDTDGISYPLIFSGFIIVSLLLARFTRNFKPRNKFFISFFWAYSFFWFSFSGGIVWYGYILLLTGLLLIVALLRKLSIQDPEDYRKINLVFKSFAVIWILLAIALRTSDIQPYMDNRFFAKGMFNPVFYDFAAGKIDKDESLDIIYADVSKAINRINEDENSLIWRVGTSFSYFIKNNNERIILDNQLGLFYQLKQRYPDNLELVDVMKASNIKYIILDLNTYTIDYTPDRSLTNKYREMLMFVINNPYLKLLATDRVVGNKNDAGQMIYTRDIYGEIMHQHGRYAIFEVV